MSCRYICDSDRHHNKERWYMEVDRPRHTADTQDDSKETERELLSDLKKDVEGIEVRVGEQMMHLRTSIDEVHTLIKGLERNLEFKVHSRVESARRKQSRVDSPKLYQQPSPRT